MKKRNVTALSEILANDINVGANLTEDFQQFLFNKVLGIPSGIVFGLAITQNGVSGFTAASGALVDLTYSYGELESASGVSLTTIPTGGTRTDTISARFLEVSDSPGASYVLIDVESRTQTTNTIYRRKFGSIQIELHEDTASGALIGNRIPLATLTVTSGGIQAVTDVRTFVKPSNVDTSAIAAGGDVSGNVDDLTVTKIQNIAVSTTDPTSGQVLTYNGSTWIPSGAADTSTFLTSGNYATATPQDVKGTASVGTGTKLALENHVHYSPYDIAGGSVGKPSASGHVLNFVSPRAWDIPASGVGCYLTAQTAATASGVFTMYKNGSSFGTITVAASGTTGTFSGFSLTSFAASDVFRITAPTTQDSTLADIGITIKGILT